MNMKNKIEYMFSFPGTPCYSAIYMQIETISKKKIQHRLKDEFYNNNFIEVMFHQIRNEIKQHYKQKNVL
jgi:hypothetical protein